MEVEGVKRSFLDVINGIREPTHIIIEYINARPFLTTSTKELRVQLSTWKRNPKVLI